MPAAEFVLSHRHCRALRLDDRLIAFVGKGYLLLGLIAEKLVKGAERDGGCFRSAGVPRGACRAASAKIIIMRPPKDNLPEMLMTLWLRTLAERSRRSYLFTYRALCRPARHQRRQRATPSWCKGCPAITRGRGAVSVARRGVAARRGGVAEASRRRQTKPGDALAQLSKRPSDCRPCRPCRRSLPSPREGISPQRRATTKTPSEDPEAAAVAGGFGSNRGSAK